MKARPECSGPRQGRRARSGWRPAWRSRKELKLSAVSRQAAAGRMSAKGRSPLSARHLSCRGRPMPRPYSLVRATRVPLTTCLLPNSPRHRGCQACSCKLRLRTSRPIARPPARALVRMVGRRPTAASTVGQLRWTPAARVRCGVVVHDAPVPRDGLPRESLQRWTRAPPSAASGLPESPIERSPPPTPT